MAVLLTLLPLPLLRIIVLSMFSLFLFLSLAGSWDIEHGEFNSLPYKVKWTLIIFDSSKKIYIVESYASLFFSLLNTKIQVTFILLQKWQATTSHYNKSIPEQEHCKTTNFASMLFVEMIFCPSLLDSYLLTLLFFSSFFALLFFLQTNEESSNGRSFKKISTVLWKCTYAW